MICNYFPEPTYLFFTEDLPALLYYSHIPVALLALFVGLFILVHNPKHRLNQLLFLITLCFAAWTTINLTAWTNINADLILTLWPFFGILSALISILSIYFIYVFATDAEPTLKVKAALLALITPVLLLAHTNMSVSGFNITECNAFDFESFIYHTYYSSLGIIAMVWIFLILARKYRVASSDFKKQILLMGLGIEFFLFTFFTIVYLVAFLTSFGLAEDSQLEFYGMFGMSIFIIFIGILLTKFRTFKVGVVAAQSLVVALIALIGSQFTFAITTTSIVLTGITLVLTGTIGIFLIRTVKKEIKQREEIESLAKNLAKANARLKELDKQKSEFVSIASHQLRSPLTAIRGYASMVIEGSYGQIPEKAKASLIRIEESAKLMAMSIEDYLNVSRIESGNMKYVYSDFNLNESVNKICDDLRPEAMKQNLILINRSNLSSRGVVHADVGKTHQIIHNLINNAIKYTQKGSISVFVRDDVEKKRIYVDITDTGIGMSEKTLHTIFQKFERANNANSVNVSGTGLGLYVALKMAEAMGGDITAHSEGDGKGSRFTIELPLAM